MREALVSDPLDNEHPIPGLYERLITNSLRARIDEWKRDGWSVEELPVSEKTSTRALARYVGDAIEHHLNGMTPTERVLAINVILHELTSTNVPKQRIEPIERGPLHLSSVARPGDAVVAAHPSTPMVETGLLTNAPNDPNLRTELCAEIPSADRIDLLCAFVKMSGIRLLEDELLAARERNIPIRVLTTTYMGATDYKAVDHLVLKYGAQVKVNYETQSTRLHAKSWLFRRNTGYDTAYVGSSNLSEPALLEGLEWNVRLSAVASPDAMRKFVTTFENYWNDQDFETYNPATDSDRLKDALNRAGAMSAGKPQPSSKISRKFKPRTHQRDMLERLSVERKIHGRTANLLVAATGTGKTVMAALDYLRLCEQAGKRIRLLFVAHRREILDQSLHTYRDVLAEPLFGERFVAGKVPEKWNHVFASVQALTQNVLEQFAPDHFDMIVVDEFHHASAPTYRRLIEYFHPQQMLGLTATPERMDGAHVQDEYFDGRIAAELRLWEALDNDLLSPFHYFGVADGTDMTRLRWKGNSYDHQALNSLYTGNVERAEVVYQEVEDKVADSQNMRALGFCVSIDHAKFMANYFCARNIKALALSSKTPDPERKEALAALKAGEVQVLFSVDLFNEGLDVPDVDTLLFLRPTESVTVFLQQFGRGLRRTPNKEVLTVLDFIGVHRAEYPFESRLHALTNLTRNRLIHGIEQDFPNLPPGCQIILDEKSKEIVIANIKTRIGLSVDKLAKEVREFGHTKLATYLRASGRDIKEIYKGDHSWTELLRKAKLIAPGSPDGEGDLLKRMSALLHVDDPKRSAAYRCLMEDDAPSYYSLKDSEKAYARMLYFTLWPLGTAGGSYQDGLETLRGHPAFREEACQVLDYVLDHADHLPLSLTGKHESIPLFVHSAYSREEILSALGEVELGKHLPGNFREGVKWCQDLGIDALLTTLEKEEKDFTPGTRYDDYAITSTRFHSESQGATAAHTPTGQRYQKHREQGSDVFLFVRRYKQTDIGTAHPWVFLGPVTYVSHEGNKPMGIVWDLEYEMPADIQAYSSTRTTA